MLCNNAAVIFMDGAQRGTTGVVPISQKTLHFHSNIGLLSQHASRMNLRFLSPHHTKRNSPDGFMHDWDIGVGRRCRGLFPAVHLTAAAPFVFPLHGKCRGTSRARI